MNVCVFCSSNNLPDKYTEPAKRLAELIADGGHTLIYGGSDYGLMKVMADGMQLKGGKVVGITIDVYSKYVRKNIDEVVIAKTLGERKAQILERSDIIIMLVGGLGTLDEATEILELKKQDTHDKPVIILNTDSFYDGLQQQLHRMAEEGFLNMGEQNGMKTKTLEQFITFVDTPDEIAPFLTGASHEPGKMEIPEIS